MVDGKRVQAFKKSLGPDKPAGHRRKARAARRSKMAWLQFHCHTAQVRSMCGAWRDKELRRIKRNRRKAAKR